MRPVWRVAPMITSGSFFPGDLRAHFRALGQVTFMQFANARHVRVAQFEFRAQPGQIIRGLGATNHGGALTDPIRDAENRRGQRQRAAQNDERTVHGLARGVRGDGGQIVHLRVMPGQLPAFQRAGENTGQHQDGRGGGGEPRSQDPGRQRIQPRGRRRLGGLNAPPDVWREARRQRRQRQRLAQQR